jgi:hypothetical protein
MTNFNQLLTKYSINKGDGIQHTNTRIGDKKLTIRGGNYHIPDEEYPNFIKSYYNDVIIGNKIEYLTEKQLDTGCPILIDLDFKFSYELTTRLITEKHIGDILALYFEEINCLFQIDGPINAYVFLKDNVNRVEDKQITKDGIHIIIAMQCDHNVQMILREKVMANIEYILGDLPLTNSWDDIFDEGITKGGTNWQLCGSRKPANDVYKLVQCYIVEKDPVDREFMYNSSDINEYYNEDNFYKLSVRNKEIPFFFMNNDFADHLSKESDIKEKKTSPNSSPSIITNFEIEKYIDYAGIIDVSVLKNYEPYFKFQKASSNIGIPFQIFDDIVNKPGAGNYDKEKNKDMYNQPHNEGNKIGWRFIYTLAGESNPEQKKNLMLNIKQSRELKIAILKRKRKRKTMIKKRKNGMNQIQTRGLNI